MPSNTKTVEKGRVVLLAHCHHCLDFFEVEAMMEGNRIVKVEQHTRIFQRYFRPHHTCCNNGRGYLSFFY